MDGSTLYGSFELSFNTVDKTSILKVNDTDILISISSKASASNVCTTQEILYFYIAFANSFNNKADKTNTYLKTDVNVCLSILQAGINNRVLRNAIDINCKFKINATTNDMFQIQNVDGSTLYDSLELPFNTIDKTSILKMKNINMLASLSSNMSASNVYTKQEIHYVNIAFANSLNTKADKTNT